MKKIKYQGGITKMITSRIAQMKRKDFHKLISVDKQLSGLKERVDSKVKVDMDVVSFSSSNDFCEQVLSILSYLRYVGNPESWTIYSDGSHTSQQAKMVENVFSFVRIVKVDWDNEKLVDHCKPALDPCKEYLLHYARSHPLGKKLFCYLNYTINKTTLFLDSDVLFYQQAIIIKSLISENGNGWFLPDAEWGCLDSHYKRKQRPQLYQVNTGFILFKKELTHFTKGLEFLKGLNYKYEYFSEQTIVHILLNDNDFIPFDPRIFILNSNDQFDISYLYSREKMAIRHYTGPVRHKMWQKGWKWHLSVS